MAGNLPHRALDVSRPPEPTGPAVSAAAHLLRADGGPPARFALARKHPVIHGFAVPLTHRLCHYQTVHYD